MRKMVMNVTPAEFSDIWKRVGACVSVDEYDAGVAHMESAYGCKRYTTYRVVVHYEARCIPAQGLSRFEPGAGVGR